MSGKLFVVGTPIGNLEDISERALKTLSECDFIAAEDTRVTVKILNRYNIKKTMVSYHEHNRARVGQTIADRIYNGENCALVTDAGMPAISDPGTELVDLCHEIGISVVSVPGPSAVITAIAISGLNASRFTFEGFLTVNKNKRREDLERIKAEQKTMVFYEAPHKLSATLKDLANALGDRKIAIIKELTKIHETVERTSLIAAAEKYNDIKPKGEFVLIIEAQEEKPKLVVEMPDALTQARRLMENGFSANEAAKQIARETGLKKGDIYKHLVQDTLA